MGDVFGSDERTVTQTSGISPEFQPYLRRALGRGEEVFLDRPAEQQLAGFSQPELQAMQRQQQLFSQPFSFDPTAMQTIRQTAAGEGFTSPQFQQQFEAAARNVLPRVQSGFASAGRSDSGLARAAETEALANAYAGLAGQERGRQLQAAQLLPSLQQQQLQTQSGLLSSLAGVGGQQRAMEQALLDMPGTQVSRFAQLLAGLPLPTQSTQTQPVYSSPLAQIAGLGLGAASLMVPGASAALPAAGTLLGSGFGGGWNNPG